MRRLRAMRPAATPPRPGTSIPGDLLLAQDPATPAETLRLLVERYGHGVEPGSKRPQVQVMKACARNPNTAPELLVELSEGYAYEVFLNPALGALLLEDPDLANQLGAEVREMLGLPPRSRACAEARNEDIPF